MFRRIAQCTTAHTIVAHRAACRLAWCNTYLVASPACAFLPLTMSVRWVATSGDGDEEFKFDPTAHLQRESAHANASSNTDRLLQQWLPEGAPEAARSKVAEYLRKHPVDQLILNSTVKITHMENEEGEEAKVSNLSPMPLRDAIESAKERGMHVVQMGEGQGMAFVRIRDEKKRILTMVAEDLSSVTPAAPEKELRLKNSVDHVFRDVVDAHFISWKSKKIVEDMKKLHPVKVGIHQFQSAEAAVQKLREMSNAIKAHAESTNVVHHFTSINASDREVAILFSPSPTGKANASKTVKHPGEKEWDHTLKRLQGALQKSGRSGTYHKVDILKPRNMGSMTYRVDKYGRRLS